MFFPVGVQKDGLEVFAHAGCDVVEPAVVVCLELGLADVADLQWQLHVAHVVDQVFLLDEAVVER